MEIKKKKLIALDISLSKTGTAYCFNDNIELDVLKNNNGLDLYKMYNNIRAYIDFNTFGVDCDDVIFIIEGFTQSIINNDRTGSAKDLLTLVNKVEEYIKKSGFEVVKIMPWVWRSVFNLPTKVEAYCDDFKYIARSEGHDLLKGMSVELVRLLVKHFENNKNKKLPTVTGYNVLENDEDKCEALLILLAFKTLGGVVDNDETYVNVFHVEHCMYFDLVAMTKKENGEVVNTYNPINKGFRYSDFSVFLKRKADDIDDYNDLIRLLNDGDRLYLDSLNLNDNVKIGSGAKLWRC